MRRALLVVAVAVASCPLAGCRPTGRLICSVPTGADVTEVRIKGGSLVLRRMTKPPGDLSSLPVRQLALGGGWVVVEGPSAGATSWVVVAAKPATSEVRLVHGGSVQVAEDKAACRDAISIYVLPFPTAMTMTVELRDAHGVFASSAEDQPLRGAGMLLFGVVPPEQPG